MSLGSLASPPPVLPTFDMKRTFGPFTSYTLKFSNQFNPHITIIQKPNLHKRDQAEPADLSGPNMRWPWRYKAAIAGQQQSSGAHNWQAERGRAGLRVSPTERSHRYVFLQLQCGA